MRSKVRRILARYDYPPDAEETAVELVLKQAEVFGERLQLKLQLEREELAVSGGGLGRNLAPNHRVHVELGAQVLLL